MTRGKILIVDDEELMRDSLSETLGRTGHSVDAVEDGQRALARLEGGGYDLIITDLKMPGIDGLDLLGRVREQSGDVPIVLMTAYATIETAVEAMKRGAFDYIVKPFDGDALRVVVDRALVHQRLLRENEFYRSRAGETPGILGESRAIRGVLALIDRYAPSPATLLIRGESGVGKELVAQEIHRRSPRSAAPFLKINCAALSAGVLESELFGHEKGAFTGADRRNIGRFEIADGGSLLLDEVSEIDAHLQAKLLRVLQEREFERVGSSRTIRVDVRVIATTNRDLEREISEGRFREDLYWRLNCLALEVPPLRERREDIPILVEHVLEESRRRMGGPRRRLSPEAMEWMAGHDWPGNVRELRNVLERAYILADGEQLGVDLVSAGASGVIPRRGDVDAFAGLAMEEVEKLHIIATLKRCGWHQRKTAEALGIGVRTLREKMKKWNLRASK
ncbi:MAG: sigma-54-dependent Fis family transcriptional regulator [Planctomycetes bacterium]|nr:sigma-54-dependent Fis family transcriptional regulator [Planctomycetota bacterium]